MRSTVWRDRSWTGCFRGSTAAFDTGATAQAMLDLLHAEQLNLRYIFLTHTHEDHVADLPRLAGETKAEVWASELEPAGIDGARTFKENAHFPATNGALPLSTRARPGLARRMAATSAPAWIPRSRAGALITLGAGLLAGVTILNRPAMLLFVPGNGGTFWTSGRVDVGTSRRRDVGTYGRVDVLTY